MNHRSILSYALISYLSVAAFRNDDDQCISNTTLEIQMIVPTYSQQWEELYPKLINEIPDFITRNLVSRAKNVRLSVVAHNYKPILAIGVGPYLKLDQLYQMNHTCGTDNIDQNKFVSYGNNISAWTKYLSQVLPIPTINNTQPILRPTDNCGLEALIRGRTNPQIGWSPLQADDINQTSRISRSQIIFTTMTPELFDPQPCYDEITKIFTCGVGNVSNGDLFSWGTTEACGYPYLGLEPNELFLVTASRFNDVCLGKPDELWHQKRLLFGNASDLSPLISFPGDDSLPAHLCTHPSSTDILNHFRSYQDTMAYGLISASKYVVNNSIPVDKWELYFPPDIPLQHISTDKWTDLDISTILDELTDDILFRCHQEISTTTAFNGECDCTDTTYEDTATAGSGFLAGAVLVYGAQNLINGSGGGGGGQTDSENNEHEQDDSQDSSGDGPDIDLPDIENTVQLPRMCVLLTH